MNDSPNSPDFDWVTAREKCSLEREFSLLKRFVKQNCDTKKGNYISDYASAEWRVSLKWLVPEPCTCRHEAKAKPLRTA